MTVKECQNCAMQMTKPEDFGTEKNGGPSEEYCLHCWNNGEFEDWCKNATLDEMVDMNYRFVLENGTAKTEEEARKICKEYLSVLKRWKTA